MSGRVFFREETLFLVDDLFQVDPYELTLESVQTIGDIIRETPVYFRYQFWDIVGGVSVVRGIVNDQAILKGDTIQEGKVAPTDLTHLTNEELESMNKKMEAILQITDSDQIDNEVRENLLSGVGPLNNAIFTERYARHLTKTT